MDLDKKEIRMRRNGDGWTGEYRKRGALWLHDGNLKRPHALLTSDNHSSGFFNSELVMEDPLLLDDAAVDLVEALKIKGLDITMVDRVVGPAMGAITLAHDISRHIGRERSDPCFRAYTEKEGEGGSKMMVFRKTVIRAGELILLAEDVFVTGGSIDLTAQAVVDAGGIVLPYVATLVNRSGFTKVDGREIVALIEHLMPIWNAHDCELCKGGSEAIRPKGKENWTRLNADYP